MAPTAKHSPAWSAFASPQSFEQLYTEMAYLTASLKNQGDREVELMRKLSILQEKVDSGLPADERRRSRKKMALLRSKIIEATAQKKAILLRLGDIYVELQSRETWMQIQSELYERRHSWWHTGSPGAGYATTPSDATSMIPTPLDAASPVFIPLGCYQVYNYWEPMSSCFEPREYATENILPPEPWTDYSEILGTAANDLGNHGLRFEYEDQGSPYDDCNEDRRHSLGMNLHFTKRGRRASLPSLRCLWPGLRESCGSSLKDEDPQRPLEDVEQAVSDGSHALV